jgi:hypothetical protein
MGKGDWQRRWLRPYMAISRRLAKRKASGNAHYRK